MFAEEKKSLSMQKRLEQILQTSVSDEGNALLLSDLGLSQRGADLLDAVLAALLKAALSGSVPAFKELRSLLEEQQEDCGNRLLSRLDDVLSALDSPPRKEVDAP